MNSIYYFKINYGIVRSHCNGPKEISFLIHTYFVVLCLKILKRFFLEILPDQDVSTIVDLLMGRSPFKTTDFSISGIYGMNSILSNS